MEEEHSENELQGYYLHADKHKLSQVIRNLISNALKFTPQGGKVNIAVGVYPDNGELTVPTIDEDEDIDVRGNDEERHSSFNACERKLLRIDVTDSGHGISKVRVDGLSLSFTSLP